MYKHEAASKVHRRGGGLASTSIAARGTIQLLVARGCFMVSGYLISVILARGLGPTEYGVYGVIMSVLVWVEMVANAGIPGATTKLMPEHTTQASTLAQSAGMLLLIMSLGLLLLGWVLAPALAHLFHIPTGVTLFRLALLDLPCYGVYAAYQGVLDGQRRFGIVSAGFIFYSLTKLVGILALLFFAGLSVSGALLVNSMATVGVLGYLMARVPFPKSWPAYPLMISLLLVALPLGLSQGTQQVLLNLHLWSLKSLWTGPGEAIGLYVATLNVARLCSVVPIVLAGVLFSSLSWALARQDEALAQRYIQAAARFALIVLVPVCTLLALHAEAVMALLYSRIYASGGVYLRLQLAAFGLLALFDIFLNALMATSKYYQCVGILLSLVPVACLLNLGLIPQFGALGAATSLALTMCWGTMLAAVFAYRRFGSLLRFLTVARVVIATTLITLVGTQIPGVGPWLLLKFMALLGLYVLLLGLSKEIGREDLQGFALWQRGRHKPDIDPAE